MALARTEIPFIVQTQSGGVVQGASVQINYRVGGGAASVFAAETGGSTLPNPVTTGLSGRVDGWLEEGQYTLVVSGPGITTYSQPWDVRSGGPISRYGNATIGNIGPSSQGGVGLGPDPSDVLFYRTGIGVARINSTFVVDGQMSVGQAQLVGTAVSLAIQDSVGAGLLKASFATGFADATNVPYLEVGNNTTNNDILVSGLTGIALRRVGIAAQGVVVANAIGGAIPIPTTNTLRVDYAGGRDTFALTSTAAETGITIGGDVEIYRSAANVLSSPDTFDAAAFRLAGSALASTHLADATNVGLLNAARTWTALQTHTADILVQAADLRVRQSGDTFDKVRLGWDGYVYFGSGAVAHDVTLRRSAVGTLLTSGILNAAGSATVNIGGANQVALGVASAGLVLGLAGDTNLYRSATDTLKTDDALHAVGAVIASQGSGVAQVSMGAVGPSSTAAVILGDVTVRRSSASNVTIDGDLSVQNLYVAGTQTNIGDQTSVGPLIAAYNLAGQVRVGSDPTGSPTITFGTAEDTSLYRDGPNKLRTGDALQVDGVFTATVGAAISGAALTTNRALATNETLVVQTAGVARLRVLADGTHEWADNLGVPDTASQLSRTAAGVLTASGVLNAVTGYRVNGTALASTHLSDTAALARLASPIFTGTVTVPVLSITTREEFPAGTAAAPSQTFIGDSDTGVFSPGVNQIGFATAGTSRLTIIADGTVAVAGAFTVGGVAPVLITDTRLTDARPPNGIAGGMLSGSYPSPNIADAIITNTQISATAAIADTKLATIATAGKVADTAIPATIARLVSPTFTGIPAAPTAALNTNNTQLATTAFVIGQVATVVPIGNGTAAVGTSLRYAREDHVHGTDIVTDIKVAANAAIAESKLALASDAAAGTASRRTLGTGATQAAAGNDSRLSDLRVPVDGSVSEAKLASGSVNEAKLTSTIRQQLGLNVAGSTRRGQSVCLGQTVADGGQAVLASVTVDVPAGALVYVLFRFAATGQGGDNAGGFILMRDGVAVKSITNGSVAVSTIGTSPIQGGSDPNAANGMTTVNVDSALNVAQVVGAWLPVGLNGGLHDGIADTSCSIEMWGNASNAGGSPAPFDFNGVLYVKVEDY